jgi:hypothetical protein
MAAAATGANALGTGQPGDPVQGCGGTGGVLVGFKIPLTRTKIHEIKTRILTFTSDHQVMQDNNTDWQWPIRKSLFTKPEWEFGKPSKPISHTKNSPVSIEVDFDVYPRDADPTNCRIVGTANFGSLVFKVSGNIEGGIHRFSATSTSTLPDEVDKLTGEISWIVDTDDDGSFDAGKSWGHTIYVTIDTPVADFASVGVREEGVTQKRMEKAVELVKATGLAKPPWANRPHEIVKKLMGLIPGYTLESDPAVPVALSHPDYFNSLGGAWNIADFIAKSAECQAIVRFVRAVIKQVGCPGLTQIMCVFTDPSVNNGKTVLENDQEHAPAGGPGLHHTAHKMINRRDCKASLVDEYPGDAPGKVFDSASRGRLPGIGSNAFEACLKFSHGGVTKYYPGGEAEHGVAPALDTKEEIITSFFALVWLSDAPGGQPNEKLVKVEQIVKRYKDKHGSAI